MSGNVNQQDYWGASPDYYTQGQEGSFNFEIPVQQEQQFGQELSFQSFDATATPPLQDYPNVYATNPYLNPNDAAGNMYGAAQSGEQHKYEGEFEDEPPLLEELGINPDHIIQKVSVFPDSLCSTLTVLNPFRTPEAAAVQDTDYAGPLVFCLVFGTFLLLSGKVHFSYIYGFGVLGCLAVWALLSLMSSTGVALGTVVTVLGYCILPMVALSGVNVILSLQGYIGTVLASVAIFWCSLSASKLFVTALSMDHQQPLVMYPCALVYGVFALITVF